MTKIKTALVTFYTEGAPYDKGKNLTSAAAFIKEKSHTHFDCTVALSPRLLIQQDERWSHIIYNNKDYAIKHLASIQRKSSINQNWINLNSLLWKPAILLSLLAESSPIEEESIIIYHDIDAQKYPVYSQNYQGMSEFFVKKLKNHSIALVTDQFFSLDADCKQEVLRIYLGSRGRTLCHKWAGCFAMKKDRYARQFCSDWYSLTAKEENRSQITSFDSHPGFIWHSQEQSTLSVTYYLWKYSIPSRQCVTSIFTPELRLICHEWRLKTTLKFLEKAIKWYVKLFSIQAFIERVRILFFARSSLEALSKADCHLPHIRIDHQI